MAQRTASLPNTQVSAPSIASRLTPRMRGIIIRQIFLQIFLLSVLISVLFPVLWIISMAIDPRGITRPTDLNLFPPNASLGAFNRLLTEPFSNVLPLYFGELLMNSLFIALGTSVVTVVLGSSAAYAFSRFRFIGRQAGMLGFIILLMLPSTGIVIPLYVLFSSIQVNSTLVAVFPSLFGGAVIAGLIWLVYNMVRTFGKYSYERSFNPSPLAVAVATGAFWLVIFGLLFWTMFQRSPLYASTYDAPVKVIRTELDSAQEDYNRRVNSVAQRERTAIRSEDNASVARDALAINEDLLRRVADLNSADEIRTLMQSQLDARLAAGYDEDDPVVNTLQTAIPILDTGGVAGFKAGLQAAVESVRQMVTDAEASATTARNNADEAAANLKTAETRLADAQRAFDQDASAIYAQRDQAFSQVIPYILLSWAAALAGAAIIWGILYVLRAAVPPRAVINVMAWAVILAVFIGVSIIALQGRLANISNPNGTQTLRTTLIGLALAFASGGLPFAIWNLKGYFDTIPKELEEAAVIDGAGFIRTFVQVIMPLALPAFAIVILFSFMQGWTEFILSWIFLTGATGDYTLAMALATMANGANSPPPDMQKFAAMAILISAPIMILFFAFQRWIVGGLSIGGVKG